MKQFSIVLLIRHPNIDPADISHILGLKPYTSWRSGDPRVTPRGTVLLGLHKSSTWNYIQEWRGEYSFANEIENFVLQLYQNKGFFLRLVNEKAHSEIFVQLPGNKSQGDSIKPEVLGKISELGLYFGAEVFPKYKTTHKA
jgi:hypothetical protein